MTVSQGVTKGLAAPYGPFAAPLEVVYEGALAAAGAAGGTVLYSSNAGPLKGVRASEASRVTLSQLVADSIDDDSYNYVVHAPDGRAAILSKHQRVVLAAERIVLRRVLPVLMPVAV